MCAPVYECLKPIKTVEEIGKLVHRRAQCGAFYYGEQPYATLADDFFWVFSLNVTILNCLTGVPPPTAEELALRNYEIVSFCPIGKT